MENHKVATGSATCESLPMIFAALMLMVFLLFLFRIGSKDFWTAAEARTALIAQSMISSGDYVIPKINGETYLTKPPLYHWLVALLGLSSGRVSEKTSTLPAALSAIACVGATVWLAARILGTSAGLWSGAVLATMPRFLWQGRVSEIDMTLTLSIVLCMLAINYLHTCSMPWQKAFSTIFFAISLSATTLLKGPPGVIVVLLTAIAYPLFKRERAIPNVGRFVLGLLIFLALVVPWPVAVVTRMPSAFAFFFHESTSKIYSPEAHRHAIFYYFPQIIAGTFPWVCFLPATFLWLRRRDNRSDTILPLIWAGVVLIFFTIVRTKQSHYVIPLYPALAILLGGTISWLAAGASEFRQRPLFRYTMRAFLAGIVGIAIAEPVAIAVRLSASPIEVAGCTTGVAFALAALVLYKKGKTLESLCASVLFMFVFLLQTIVIAVPLINSEMSPRFFAHEVARHVPSDGFLGMYSDVRPHVLYYVGREIKPVSASEMKDFFSDGSASYLIIPERDFRNLTGGDRYEVIVSYKDFKYQNHKYLLITRKDNSWGQPGGSSLF